jgi:hypothetical protein
MENQLYKVSDQHCIDLKNLGLRVDSCEDKPMIEGQQYARPNVGELIDMLRPRHWDVIISWQKNIEKWTFEIDHEKHPFKYRMDPEELADGYAMAVIYLIETCKLSLSEFYFIKKEGEDA